MAGFFEDMLRAVLEGPEAMDVLRARTVLESAGSDLAEAAIRDGDPHASALWCMAQGETRYSIAARIDAGPKLH